MTLKPSSLVTIHGLLESPMDLLNCLFCGLKPESRKAIIGLMTCKLRNIFLDGHDTADQFKPNLCNIAARNVRELDAHDRIGAVFHAVSHTPNNQVWRPFVNRAVASNRWHNLISKSQQFPRCIAILLPVTQLLVASLPTHYPDRHKDRTNRPNRLHQTSHIRLEPTSTYPITERGGKQPQTGTTYGQAPQGDKRSLDHDLTKLHTGQAFLAAKPASLPALSGNVHGGITA